MLDGAHIHVRVGVHSEVTVERAPGSSIPEPATINLTKVHWELTTIGTGVGIGGVVGNKPGAVIGGAVFYAWGRWLLKQARNR